MPLIVEHPSASRVTGAVFAAALAAAAPTLILGPLAIIALPIGFGIAFGHTLLLGLPLYLFMRNRGEIAWWHAALAGVLIGAIPMMIYLNSVIDYGSWNILSGMIFGGCGFLGGMAFRAVTGPSRREEAFDARVFE